MSSTRGVVAWTLPIVMASRIAAWPSSELAICSGRPPRYARGRHDETKRRVCATMSPRGGGDPSAVPFCWIPVQRLAHHVLMVSAVERAQP